MVLVLLLGMVKAMAMAMVMARALPLAMARALPLAKGFAPRNNHAKWFCCAFFERFSEVEPLFVTRCFNEND